MSRILIIDNYDSFTYNLVALLREIPGTELVVRRNDACSPDDLQQAQAIVLSPGPGIPSEAGDLMSILEQCAGRVPILGVCLGLQAIAEHYGARLINLSRVYHGVATPMQIVNREEPLFQGVDEIFMAGRYHSWAVDPGSLPDELQVSALDENGQIMALRHRHFAVAGLQFHPESVLTPQGPLMLQNFVAQVRKLALAA